MQIYLCWWQFHNITFSVVATHCTIWGYIFYRICFHKGKLKHLAVLKNRYLIETLILRSMYVCNYLYQTIESNALFTFYEVNSTLKLSNENYHVSPQSTRYKHLPRVGFLSSEDVKSVLLESSTEQHLSRRTHKLFNSTYIIKPISTWTSVNTCFLSVKKVSDGFFVYINYKKYLRLDVYLGLKSYGLFSFMY